MIYKCDQCEHVSGRRDNLREHMRRCHGTGNIITQKRPDGLILSNRTRRSKLKLTALETSDSKEKKSHESDDVEQVLEPKTEDTANQEDYPCDTCGLVLLSSSEFIKHTDSEHSGKAGGLYNNNTGRGRRGLWEKKVLKIVKRINGLINLLQAMIC